MTLFPILVGRSYAARVTTDRPTDQPTSDQLPDQPVSLAAAAAALGVSREAVRLRIRRGTLRGERRPDGWVVWLEAPAEELVGRAVVRPTDQRDRPTRRPAKRASGDGDAELRARIAWLEARVEAGETERAELRRMLNLEQQTVAELRRLPAGREVVSETDTGSPPESYYPPAGPQAHARPAGHAWWRFWQGRGRAPR